MMMMGLKFMNQVPFKQVYIYSLVADEEGKKMSKSKGNVVNPLDLIEQYGTDALRFTLTSIETRQRYVSLTPDRLESSRNFVNKLYNATRFFLMGISDGTKAQIISKSDYLHLRLEDKWILTRLQAVIDEVTEDYENYQVAELSQALYRFVWNDFCDWYLECAKPRLYAEANSKVKRLAASVVVTVLDNILRLLHPVMPFVTEELWHRLDYQKNDSIMMAKWPKGSQELTFFEVQNRFKELQEIVTEIRTSRNELNVPPSAQVRISTPDFYFADGSDEAAILKNLCRVTEILKVESRPSKTALAVVPRGRNLHPSGRID